MIRKEAVIIIFFILLVIFTGCRNDTQTVIDLIDDGKFSEAREMYISVKDSKTVDEHLNSKIDLVVNNYRSSKINEEDAKQLLGMIGNFEAVSNDAANAIAEIDMLSIDKLLISIKNNIDLINNEPAEGVKISNLVPIYDVISYLDNISKSNIKNDMIQNEMLKIANDILSSMAQFIESIDNSTYNQKHFTPQGIDFVPLGYKMNTSDYPIIHWNLDKANIYPKLFVNTGANNLTITVGYIDKVNVNVKKIVISCDKEIIEKSIDRNYTHSVILENGNKSEVSFWSIVGSQGDNDKINELFNIISSKKAQLSFIGNNTITRIITEEEKQNLLLFIQLHKLHRIKRTAEYHLGLIEDEW